MWHLYSCCSVWHTTHFGSFRECQSPIFLANFVSTLYPIFNDIHSNQDINVSRLWWSRGVRRTSPSVQASWTYTWVTDRKDPSHSGLGLTSETYTWVTDHKDPLYSVLRLTSEPFSESLSKPKCYDIGKWAVQVAVILCWVRASTHRDLSSSSSLA